jgi:oligosaccharide repeat unit polymerase
MPLFEFPDLLIVQLICLVMSGVWLLKRNDELPLIMSSFLLYCGSYRYWAVTQGIARGWVQLGNFGFTAITDESALIALAYIVFGEVCVLVTYGWHQRRKLPVLLQPLEPQRQVLRWIRPRALGLGLFCVPLVVLARAQLLAQYRLGRSLGFEVSSYLSLFPLALVGIATLLLCLWKFRGFTSLLSKITVVVIMITLAQMTFAPSGRFQFLGWIIASGVVISSTYRPKVRLIMLTSLAVVALALFATAGAMRNQQFAETDLNQAAWERAFSAEDANMLDGFVLIQEVYPERLDFSYGMEHLEVLMRPIPRSLWPGKPVGGYMNKLGLIDANTGFTLGISPTLFGSFYAEGKLLGILIFSVVYGWVFALIVRRTIWLHPFAAALVRAMLCASLVPLLRGGDLPGIYAWIGMAFWPCFLVLWVKRREFRLPSVTAPATRFPWEYYRKYSTPIQENQESETSSS